MSFWIFRREDSTTTEIWPIGINRSFGSEYLRLRTKSGSLDLFHNADGLSGSAVISYEDAGFTDNAWMNLVYVYNGTSWKIYVNGEDKSSFLTNTNIPSRMPGGSGTSPNAIGGYWSSNATAKIYDLDGYMSNLALWDSALSEPDAISIYNQGTPGDISSLSPKNWWKLYDNILDSGSENNDASGTSVDWESAISVDIPVSSSINTISKNMTEQSLVNNNVSTLNGESSGMTSGNLVLSDLTRNLPYENYSLNFDTAQSDYIQLPLSTFVYPGEFALSVWVNPTILSSDQVIFGNGSSSNNWLRLSSATQITFKIDSNSQNFTEGSGNDLVVDTWQHLLITRDSSNDVKIYRNGVIFGAATNYTETLTISSIGYRGLIHYDGNLSSISIFDTGLTSTEALKLYANGIPQDLTSFTPQPVSWWTLGKESFWDGSGWVFRDMIGSNDGTGQNIALNDLVGNAPGS
jgi:hypothetical protein